MPQWKKLHGVVPNRKINFRRLGKIAFIMEEIRMPTTTNLNYWFWKSKISTIISWLLSIMDRAFGKPYMFLPSTKDSLDAVKATYSDT